MNLLTESYPIHIIYLRNFQFIIITKAGRLININMQPPAKFDFEKKKKLLV